MRGLWWVPLLAVAASAVALIDGDSGLVTWWELRTELRASNARIANLRAEVADLERETSSLEKEPAAIEQAIREDLGFARAGEVVVRLPGAGAASQRIP